MSQQLRLEPDTIAKCVSVCEGMIDQLSLALDRAEDLKSISGFGTFPSAVQLQSGYRAKGFGGPASVVELLNRYVEIVTHLRDAFADSGAAYEDADSVFVRSVVGLEDGDATGLVSGRE